MRGFEGLERRLTRWRNGSSHPNYRQPIWRALHDVGSDQIPMSHMFEGDPRASSCSSRKWESIAVVKIEPSIWGSMVKAHPGGAPALIFGFENEPPRRIGRLTSYDDVGTVGIGEARYPGHGLRFGNVALQFTIAIVMPDNQLFRVPEDAIISDGPIRISEVGVPGSGYEHMYFSS